MFCELVVGFSFKILCLKIVVRLFVNQTLGSPVSKPLYSNCTLLRHAFVLLLETVAA